MSGGNELKPFLLEIVVSVLLSPMLLGLLTSGTFARDGPSPKDDLKLKYEVRTTEHVLQPPPFF